ncbi:MAG: hypothetical protein B7X65_22105 [Polaromonas sp. 39-63-25]|nr:MAG: hypothetical protein B7Y60_22175 [Polaromonas sp. 35-63-35]OYZ15985.1 MAG: hypothetical protein B7Y28_21685 [Polaromonas sp. 16-63-31]OYZ75818.1 MAG: hypothetical protein B7Y09_22790 [Polaromonas sp. 24-63-21]OZA47000.1 MAG: hypothetical protein B7X88_22920 [Polaromonas sp. 17-63-33]OZA85285.1 MAG: hypothetical protein B7X65_22105 [Polaromonas sp. 39-63-25]
MRPAWAHSRRCKSSRELVTVSEVKRNCMRATECGKEAWNVNHEPMDKNQIEGVADQGDSPGRTVRARDFRQKYLDVFKDVAP